MNRNRFTTSPPRIGALATCCLLLLVITGCGYNRRSAGFMSHYEKGELAPAQLAASKAAGGCSQGDRVVFYLETAMICRAAGDLRASNAALAKADECITEYDKQADVKITYETAAAMTNQTVLPYKGYAYDRILVNTYKALNHMELGEFDQARVECIRAYQRQQDAVARYAKQIEQYEQLKKDKQKYDFEKAEADVKYKKSIDDSYKGFKDFSGYTNYVNPFSEYVQGLYFLACGIDSRDREWAVDCMRRVSSMVPQNVYVKHDLSVANAVANGYKIPPTTYVFFETGMAPQRGTVRIDVPLFLVNNRVDYVGAAFPTLQPVDGACCGLDARTSAGATQAQLLCDMDSVVAQEFKNEMPMVVTRTIISTVTKAMIAYGLNEATRPKNEAQTAGHRSNSSADAWKNTLVRLGTTAYQYAMNQADLRTWQTLPKQFYVCKLATPGDRQVTLSFADGTSMSAQIDPGVINVLYVKSIRPGVPPVIRQFKLK